ncbi:MAG TPA: MFS transporter [Desulfobacterales bacterium]|nr:MFS transporter [Desulfobacterales bacterium]
MERRSRRVFGVLFLSIFAAIMGVGIVVPLLPVYARGMGASGIYIGMIFGAFSLSRTFLLPFFGRLSDRRGRKPFIVCGLLCYALISLAFMRAGSVETLILVRFVQGIASAMIMPVSQAYVGDITPVGNEGLTMGLFNMSVFWGLSVGPLIGGLINDRFNLDAAFGCMGLLALVGCLASLLFLPPTRSERVVSRVQAALSWKLLLCDREIAALFCLRFAYTACIGIIWGFLPVFADNAFALTSSAIGVLVMLGVFISGLIHVPMGYLADRFNRPAMILTGSLMVSAAILGFNWTRGFWSLFAVNVLFGIGGGVAMPALMALAVIKGNRTAAMGSVMGLLTMAHSLGMLAGALLAGVMMDLFELRHAFVLGSALMLCGSIVFGVLQRGGGPGLSKP